MFYLGVDPGAGGCIAWLASTPVKKGVHRGVRYNLHYTKKLGDLTERDIIEAVTFDEGTRVCAVIEKVSAAPGMGVSSAFTFGRGYGLLLGVLTAQQIPFVEVSPQRWQKEMGCQAPRKTGGKGVKPGSLSTNEDYKANKLLHKRKAEQLYPSTKITNINADAILLATYCKQQASTLF